jgi:uncharacterized delta-60 repeat protein
VLAVLLGLTWTGVGLGAPGDLDPTFGAGGTVTTVIGEMGTLHAMVLQPDGKIVVGGTYSPSVGSSSTSILARYLPDGRLDAAFGNGGIVTPVVAGHDEVGLLQSLALQPDGKVVAAGWFPGANEWSTRLARYLPDGRLDPTFGSGGLVIFNLAAAANALVVQPDGKLVIAASGGAPCPPCSVDEALLVRFQPDGQLDLTFSTGGLAITPPDASELAYNV